jgi:cell division protein FtsN
VLYGRKIERVESARTEPYWTPEAVLPPPEIAPVAAAPAAAPQPATEEESAAASATTVVIQGNEPDPPPTVVIPADPPGVRKAKEAVQGGAVDAASRFSIQVAAVRDRAEADRMVANLKKQGLDAYLGPTHFGTKGRWYRVWVGKYDRKDEANKQSPSVARKAKRSTFVVSMK